MVYSVNAQILCCVFPAPSELGGEVEADGGEVVLSHLQDVVAVGEEDVATLLVYGHILMLAGLEGAQSLFVIALYPAGFVQTYRFPAALSAVFVQQSVLNHLKLELTHGADDFAVVERVAEHLRHTFVHKLSDTFIELLRLHRVGILDILEHLGGEGGEAAEMELLAGGQGVADFEIPVVGNTDDVAGEGFVDDILFLSHKGCGGGETHLFPLAHMQVVDITFELSGAYFDESDAGTVVGVHIGVNLEHETGESLLLRSDRSFHGFDGSRSRSYLHEAVEQFLDTEGVESRTEENRSRFGVQIILHTELRIDPLDEFEVFTQLGSIGLAYTGVDFGRVDVVDFDTFGDALFVGLEQVESVLVNIVNALELGTDIDRPREGADADVQFLFELVEDIKRVASLAVELVDEDYYRSLSHAAYLHQTACLSLDTFGDIDHDDYGVDGGKGAEGSLGEILMARGVEDIYFIVAVIETHYGCCDGNTALFLYLHPVGGSCFLDFVAFDGTGNVNGTTEEEELFGERRFTGVRV